MTPLQGEDGKKEDGKYDAPLGVQFQSLGQHPREKELILCGYTGLMFQNMTNLS
jgi:hypothetical protein